jgi:5'-3' exonuclease
MGVEKFFSSLKSRFSSKNKTKIKCHHFLIDFNSIVHVLSQYLLKTVPLDIKKDAFEKQLIKEIDIFIGDLLQNYITTNKLKSISICIDGVPTMAKIVEQKKRRYMGDLLSSLSPNKTIWSRNNISPGTDFMFNLVAFLKSTNFSSGIKKICPSIETITISGVDEEGEGEFKIIKLIEEIPRGDNIVVYSPDSDMIILLFQVNRSIVMLRYDQQESTYEKPSYDTIEIDKFKNIFIDYIENRTRSLEKTQNLERTRSLEKTQNLERTRTLEKTQNLERTQSQGNSMSHFFKMKEENIIADMVFILSVFGDDFLPKLETVRVSFDLNILIDFYIVCVYRHGYILNRKSNITTVSVDTFLHYLKLIEAKEDYFIERNAKHHVISHYHKKELALLGDSLYKLRDLMTSYIWKFIYLNKPKDIIVNPINVSKYISTDRFIQYIESTEISIDYKILNRFTNMNLNRVGWDKLFDSMLRIVSYNFIEILQNIKLIDHPTLNNSVHYIEYNPNYLLEALLVIFYSTYELPFNIKIEPTNEKLHYNNFDSHKPPHNTRVARMKSNEKTGYMIENKLDQYYKIFNPKDKFYYTVYRNIEYQGGNNVPIDYTSYYSIHFPTKNIKDIVHDYISGLNWIVNYYHNHIIDRSWYYRYNRSPLTHDIVKYFDEKLFTTKVPSNQLILTPLEHFIFVSPIHLNRIDSFEMISSYNINTINNFIKNNKKYFYDLDSIYKDLSRKKLVDCSSSHFISKCHLLFMENYIDINEYIKDIRRFI